VRTRLSDEELQTAAANCGARMIAAQEEQYPAMLRTLRDPPRHVFTLGNTALLERTAVAIVGTRSATAYGLRTTRNISAALASAGVAVVSGMARGIDGEAHRGALESRGVTVGVLGCGVDRDYPAAHAALARQIADSGLIVAEYPPGVEPAPWRFPARNRIIAGLVHAVVVVEARERSGALITADLALEEGREVFAVPGEITSSLSAGTNSLLRMGAHLVTAVGDVLEVLRVEGCRPSSSPQLDPEGRRVYEALSDAPATADELVVAIGLPASELAPALTRLELAGLVVEGEGLYRVVMPGS